MAEPANEGDIYNVFEAVYALKPTADDLKFWNNAIKSNSLDFKGLFYAVKGSQRYVVEHFINQGDLENLALKGIDLKPVKGKMWKEGLYGGAKGITGVNRESALGYVQDNLK